MTFDALVALIMRHRRCFVLSFLMAAPAIVSRCGCDLVGNGRTACTTRAQCGQREYKSKNFQQVQAFVEIRQIFAFQLSFLRVPWICWVKSSVGWQGDGGFSPLAFSRLGRILRIIGDEVAHRCESFPPGTRTDGTSRVQELNLLNIAWCSSHKETLARLYKVSCLHPVEVHSACQV